MLEKDFGHLSGGEQQLINLFTTLTKPNSQLIILDEPFANISNKLHLRLLSILKEVSKEKIVMIISHDHFTDTEESILWIE
ncbi:MAG: hypothetical protein Q4A90_05185 [Streptococcus sp.]|nr:hypothetical protein [Streptococcus sp.]